MPRFSWLMSGYANGIGPFGGELCPDYERHEAPKIVNFVRFRTWPLPLLSWVLTKGHCYLGKCGAVLKLEDILENKRVSEHIISIPGWRIGSSNV